MVGMGTTSASVSSPNLKRGIRVWVTLTFRGVQHLEEANTSTRRVMNVVRSVPERIVPSVVVLTVESAERARMSASIEKRTVTWSRTTHKTRVRLEVMLSLGLIHRVKQQSSLLGETSSVP